MDELRTTRHWGKKAHGSAVFPRSTYEDLFGGSSRYTSPFPMRFEDYCEIFRTKSPASSIPLLDLPPVEDCFVFTSDADRRCTVDYSQVFGEVSGGGGFTISYEELFRGSKPTVISSLHEGVQWGVPFDQESSNVSESLLNLEINEVSSNYPDVIDPSGTILEMKDQQVYKGNNNGGQENETSKNYLYDAANSENLKEDKRPTVSDYHSQIDFQVNERHHSRSSSYHSACSEEISLSDVLSLESSELSLQTSHSALLVNNPKLSKMVPSDSSPDLEENIFLKSKQKYHHNFGYGGTKIQVIDASFEDNSRHYDSEMYSTSVAAAAAVKAAMEHAQARLQSAKQLMERKQDKHKMKANLPKTMTFEKEEAELEIPLRSCRQVKGSNNLFKANNFINECTFFECEKINVADTMLSHENEESFSSSLDGRQLTEAQSNGRNSAETACEISDSITEIKYCDPIIDVGLLNQVNDNKMLENNMKDRASGHELQEISKDSKPNEQAFKVGGNKNSAEMLENVDNLNGAGMKDAGNNVVHATVEDFLLLDSASKLNMAYNYHLSGDIMKAGDFQKNNTIVDHSNLSSTIMSPCLCEDSELIFQSSNSKFKLEVDNNIFEKIKLNIRSMGNESDLHVNHADIGLYKVYKELKFANEAYILGRSDKEARFFDNTPTKMDTTEESKKLYENKIEIMRYPHSSNETICKEEENSNEVESDGLHADEDACFLTEDKGSSVKGQNEAIYDAIRLENEMEKRDAQVKLREDEPVRLHTKQMLEKYELLAVFERDYADKFKENGRNSVPKTPDIVDISHSEVIKNHKDSNYHTSEKESQKTNMKKNGNDEQALKLNEDVQKHEREREKNVISRALCEARERAERIAVERVTAEARQRALSEARERAEKAAEAEKASRAARLRAERSAVQRATEEARQRAIEKALAEKSATDAGIRMRKGIASMHFKANHVSLNTPIEVLQNTQSQNDNSTNGQRNSDYCNIGGEELKLRCKESQEREQRTAERAAKALAEKNYRDILAQREKEKRDRFVESMDAEVRRWSNGKDGNLRLLLSTLQYILGPDSGWQPIALTDVLTAAALKKAFRKATLCVHPDKLQQRGASFQQKYVCEKVFDLLKDAWDKFNSDER